jgi:hypothetical protein
MTVRSSTLYCAGALALAVVSGASALWATGCSSSSTGTQPASPVGDDMDGSTAPGDGGGSMQDATVPMKDTGTTNTGDDGSSPLDAGSTANPSAAGDAGATLFCNAICAGLLACAADAGPCHCSPGSSALERTDFVGAFTSCVQSAIVADCADAGGAVQDCQVSAAVSINPTTAAATFCKNLELTRCSQILPDCLSNAGIYADTTINAFSSCFADLPDADIDGGCTAFGTCLGTASSP